MTRDVTLDNPAELPEEDEFNRWPFCKRLAETILGFDTSQGAPVLGLFGRWGYGKSTVLNFVRAALERENGQRVTVFTFNPWLYKDADTLLRQFYMGLASSIDVDLTKAGAEIGEFLKKYSGVISGIPGVGSGLSKALEGFGKDLADDPTPALRQRLIEIMRSATKRVIVLIDDLDRVDRDEIMTMLKLVRLSANVPNVVYLLAFDEERVARVAGRAYGERADGRQFLEKIIQYPFSVPAVGADILVAFVIKHARKACDEAKIVFPDRTWDEFRLVCKEDFSIALNTPRQAIRYANALRFALPMLKGEVDPIDQMIIEAIKILFPALYRHLRDARDFKDFETANLPDNERKAAESLIAVLSRHRPDTDKPLSDPRYHGRYFSYAVATDDVSDAEIEGILSLSNGEQEKLNLAVRGLAQSRLPKLIERLGSVTDQKILSSLQHAQGLAIALSLCGDLLPTDGDHSDQRLATDMAIAVAKLSTCLFALQEDKRQFIAPTVLERATPLSFAWQVYNQLRALEEGTIGIGIRMQRQESDFKLDWRQLDAILVQRIAQEASATPPYKRYRSEDAFELLRYWRNHKDQEVKSWLEARLGSHPCEASYFLGMFGELYVNYRYIDDYVNTIVVAEALRQCFGDAIANEDKPSPELYRARKFLDIHYKNSGHTSVDPQPPTTA
ncbi:KAP family P-loop domain protein [Caballeronia arvi]|uniref:KAP family P-loop domain protein n=2 Tax=Caballeronia arvi TaxID=1777135 RepID=A0A158KIR5_9BURK|nr:KAP family P-loop domain protein [Caballeronia arvi]